MWKIKGACAKNLGRGGDLGFGAGEVRGESVEDDEEPADKCRRGGGMSAKLGCQVLEGA